VSLRYISQDGTVTWLPEDWSASAETPVSIPPSLKLEDTRMSPPSAQGFGWLWVVVRQFFGVIVTMSVAVPLFAMGPIFVAWWTASDSVGGGHGRPFLGLCILLADAGWLWYELRRQARIRRLMDEGEPGYAEPAPDPRELGPMTVPALWVLGGIVGVVGLQGILGHYPDDTIREVLVQAQVIVAVAGLIYAASLRRRSQTVVEGSGRH
jgi:hypothetical protein